MGNTLDRCVWCEQDNLPESAKVCPHCGRSLVGSSFFEEKTELSLNLSSSDVFRRLQDYFETSRLGYSHAFSIIEKTSPSHIEGKWLTTSSLSSRFLGGNFKIDIIEDNNESKVRVNIDARNVNLFALGLFLFGLLLLMTPLRIGLIVFSLMLFGFATAFFIAGQRRIRIFLREINELLLNIPEIYSETTEIDYEKAIVKGEEHGRKTPKITDIPEGFTVNLPAENIFNKLVDYFGADYISKRIPFSLIEGRWGSDSFKIDIISNNYESQVKTNFSFFIPNLFALLFVVMFFGCLFIWFISQTFNSNFFLACTLIIVTLIMVTVNLIERWRMKRNAIKRLKELFQNVNTK